MSTVERFGGSERLAPLPGSPEFERQRTLNGGHAAQTMMATGLPNTPEAIALRNSQIESQATRWSRDMVVRIVPNVVRQARIFRTGVVPQFRALPQLQSGLESMMAKLIQRGEEAIKSQPPNAFPVFFALEDIGRALEKAKVQTTPGTMVGPLKALHDFVGQTYQEMNIDRPMLRREGHRGREVDSRVAMMAQLTFTVVALGGFLAQGLIYFLGGKDPNTGERLVNPRALQLYGGLLVLGTFGHKLAGAFGVPGTNALVNSLSEVQFLGTAGGTFENLARTHGIHGPAWTPVARGVYRNRGAMTTFANGTREITQDERKQVLALASGNADVRRTLETMLNAEAPNKPKGQPARQLVAQLLQARSPESEQVVITYFQTDAGPHQVQQMIASANGRGPQPAPTIPDPVPAGPPPGPVVA